MDENKQTKLQILKEKGHEFREWFFEHSRIVMPVFLLVCVAITVLVAVLANRTERLEKKAAAEAAAMASASETAADIAVLETPEYTLELNAYPEINDLVRKYYDAQASGKIDIISEYNSYLNEIEKLRIQELSKYIDSYPEIDVYTKPGLTEKSYVAYVCAKIRFTEIEKEVPGMQCYYIESDPEGKYSMSEGTYDEAIYEYIKGVTVQDDVVDLNNQVVVEYNDIIEESSGLSDYILYIKSMINEEVGEILAEKEAPSVTPENTTEDNGNTQVATIVNRVRVKERVNIRKSDSKEADKVGTASAGEEYTVVQKKDNGWTEIQFGESTAFINSEYLEDVTAVTVDIVDPNAVETPTDKPDTSASASVSPSASSSPSASPSSSKTKIMVNDGGVRVRKEPNTTSDVLGTTYKGDKFEYIEETNGWTKIKYKGDTGYIKSEFVDLID